MSVDWCARSLVVGLRTVVGRTPSFGCVHYFSLKGGHELLVAMVTG